MDYYKYKAKDEKGKTVSGVMNALDEIDLHNRLKENGLLLISAKEEAKEKVNAKRLKSNSVSEFARNLSELVSSGITLVHALKIISDDESIKPKEREIYSAMLKQVRSGIVLSEAMEAQGEAFPPLFINMIRSSESTGNIDEIAMQMAVYYDKEYRLNEKIKSSMTYPKILTGLIVAVVAIIFGYVIPQFESLFATMGTLPFTTRALLAISNFVKDKWYLIILFGVVFYITFKILMSIPKVRYYLDMLEIHIPKIGKLRKIVYTARFARTLASLYAAGIPIMSCLTIAKNTIGNRYIEEQFEKVIADVRAGENLSDSIAKVDGFTKKLSSTIHVGEETGSLDKMLISTANQMEYDSEIALNKMVSYLEPVMIVVMAVVVGFIIIAVIQPIYGSYESMANSY